jgi:uncharacterized membrane protein HdeD (DUF308 family)
MTIISDVRQVIRYWWVFLLSGCLLVLFAILVISLPLAAYAGLAIYFVLTFVINGLFEIGFAFSNRRAVHGWGWHLAGGLFDLLAGAVLFFTPVLAAVALPLFVGFWLLFRSISIIGRCFDLPVIWQERLWMLVLGVAGLVFSFLILYNPALGVLTLIALTACALTMIGLFYIFLGLHLRRWGNQN